MKTLLVIVIFLMCFSARSQKYIDLKSKIDKRSEEVFYSSLFSSIKYVQLETTPNNLIDSHCKVAIVDSFIVVADLNSQYLFNLRNGKYIRQIGRKGKGPGEYRSAIGLIDRKQKLIYSTGWNSDFIEYDFNGNYLGNIDILGYVDDFNSPSIPGNYTVSNSNFVCYFMNCIGIEKKLITIFNREGDIIDTKVNHNQIAKQKFALSNEESVFYHYNNKLFFNEIYNDTIFQLAPGYKKAEYVIDAGKYRLNYLAKWTELSKDWYNNILSPNIMESTNYLFFTYNLKSKMQIVVFDKKKEKLMITEELNNNLDHFLSFTPLSVVNDNQLIGVIEAYRIVEWFDKNKNNYPSEINKLLSVKIDDNPIIVVAKLK